MANAQYACKYPICCDFKMIDPDSVHVIFNG